jgi:hypothetical protein
MEKIQVTVNAEVIDNLFRVFGTNVATELEGFNVIIVDELGNYLCLNSVDFRDL